MNNIEKNGGSAKAGLPTAKAADAELDRLLEKVKHPKEGKRVGGKMLKIKKANEWALEASQRPDPRQLWRSLWHEGEICCLFADSNLGKSILAVQVASQIAKEQTVIYFDFELSDKQFQLRCTDERGIIYTFPDGLLRAELDASEMDSETFETTIIDEIEQVAVQNNAKILIIDNITYMCTSAEKGDAAGRLMVLLKQLKQKHDLSILVVAHTPKRPLSSPITQNDLAGSKKLMNFVDSAVALGQSAKDDGQRYIKQIKTRLGAFEYGANNVIVGEINKDDGLTKFKTIGFASEQEHLSTPSDKDRQVIIDNVKEQFDLGKSVREISQYLGLSRSKVHRIVKRIKTEKGEANEC